MIYATVLDAYLVFNLPLYPTRSLGSECLVFSQYGEPAAAYTSFDLHVTLA